MNSELENIQVMIDKVLEEKYPNFPREVILKILEIQHNHPNASVDAQKEVTDYLKEFLNSNPDVTF